MAIGMGIGLPPATMVDGCDKEWQRVSGGRETLIEVGRGMMLGIVVGGGGSLILGLRKEGEGRRGRGGRLGGRSGLGLG